MSLYDRMLNIANIDKETVIKRAIENTKSDLDGLEYERMLSKLWHILVKKICHNFIVPNFHI